MPIINDYWERAEFPFELVPKIAGARARGRGDRGLRLPGHERDRRGPCEHGVGARRRQHGDVLRRALEPRDADHRPARLRGAARALAAARWRALEAIGAFGLTEPEHGSDAVALETRARRDGDDYVLDGRKKWIGNASFADVVIIWARGEDGDVGGYLVEKGTPGFHADGHHRQDALRAVWQAEIALDGVRVPAENRLPGLSTVPRRRARADPHALHGRLARARARAGRLRGGAALRRRAPTSSASRSPSFQLVQDKLSRMVAEITAMQLLCLRLSELAGRRAADAGMASLAKMNHAAKARADRGRRARHPRRQRDPARAPRRPPPRRHGGRLHLRGHRLASSR